jgi:hypothetical protein
LLKAYFPVPSVPSFGLSNVVCSLDYVLQMSSSALMKLFTVTLPVSSSTITYSNLLALSMSGRLLIVPFISKNTSFVKNVVTLNSRDSSGWFTSHSWLVG